MMPHHRRSCSSSENSLPTSSSSSSSSYSSRCSPINTTTSSSSITPIPTPTRQHYSFLDAKPLSLSHQHHRPTANNSSSGASRNSCFGGCFRAKLGLSVFSFMARGDRGQPSAAARHDSGKTGSVQQRRLELEHEVANLQRVLQNEEKVHEVFQHALLPYNAKTSLHIPNSLPKEAKELLEELAMVEEEIARLEGEISKIKQGEANIQEPRRSRPYTHANTNLNSLAHQSLGVPARSLKSSGMQEKVALETKPMLFINQAIKGDYMIHDFGSKEKVRSSLETSKGKTTSRVETFEKRDRQKLVRHQQRISKRSAILESASSPKLPPMTPIPKTQKMQEINPEFSFSLPQDPSSLSTSIDKGSQRWQSNKLSEQIIKCLICIFLRLLRTSRATELEKSGNLTRSVNLSSRSLQLDGGLSLKAKPKTQRETSQQDPYGIFEFEDSIIRDIGYYKNLVLFTISSLDLKRISTSLPLLSKLRVLMSNLHDIDLRFLTHQQKLAFWINMYNICIMHGLLEHGVPSNTEEALALRTKVVLDVGGNKLNALAIEQFILRQPSILKEVEFKGNKDGQEGEVRKIYGLDHPEANVTFTLCNASKSSPVVRIYTADNVLVDLEKAKLEYLQASIVVTTTRRLMIPKLLVWNIHDFAKDLDSLVDWICNQLPASGSLRKSIVECLKAQNYRNVSDIMDIIPYDFEFQYLLPMY